MTPNQERAQMARRCLEVQAFLAGTTDDLQGSLSDLIANVGHLCSEERLDFLHVTANGIGHWHLEQTSPDTLDLPNVLITINECH